MVPSLRPLISTSRRPPQIRSVIDAVGLPFNFRTNVQAHNRAGVETDNPGISIVCVTHVISCRPVGKDGIMFSANRPRMCPQHHGARALRTVVRPRPNTYNCNVIKKQKIKPDQNCTDRYVYEQNNRNSHCYRQFWNRSNRLSGNLCYRSNLK